MKKCKSCQTEIDAKATKCPHCKTDLRSWFRRHPILTGLLGLFLFFIIVGAMGSSGSEDTTPASNTTPNANNSNPEPTEAPQQQKQWVTVIEVSGNANKKTESFELEGGQQKITYTFTGNDPVLGVIHIMEEGKDKVVDGSIYEVMTQTTGTDETIARKRAGTYYLDITGVNASWTVKVEEER